MLNTVCTMRVIQPMHTRQDLQERSRSSEPLLVLAQAERVQRCVAAPARTRCQPPCRSALVALAAAGKTIAAARAGRARGLRLPQGTYLTTLIWMAAGKATGASNKSTATTTQQPPAPHLAARRKSKLAAMMLRRLAHPAARLKQPSRRPHDRGEGCARHAAVP